MESLSVLEYQKNQAESDYLKDLRDERARNLQDSITYQEDMKRACPICHIIRAPYEIAIDTCENCELVKQAIHQSKPERILNLETQTRWDFRKGVWQKNLGGLN